MPTLVAETMNSDPAPRNDPFDAHRVGMVLRDIDEREDEDHVALLADLMCVAWPSPEARSQ